MKNVHSMSMRTMLVATAIAMSCPTGANAEKIDCSGTKTSKDAVFREVIRPGDRPDHEMLLAVRTHVIRSQNADFEGSTLTVFAMHDEYGHAGTQSGYFMYALTSGERVWARFDSVSAFAGSDDTWSSTYQGSFRFVGGTGKYAAIRGGGTYQGTVVPPMKFQERFVCEAEY